MKTSTVGLSELEALAIGATVLGSGGGGDPAYSLLMAKEQIELHGPVSIISLEDLSDNALLAPIGYMGAPLVCLEKLSSGSEFPRILELIEQHFQEKVQALLPWEIGGSNAIEPFTTAGRLNLPLVDGDTFGRAFPEMYMSSCHLAGLACSPAFICDNIGNSATVYPLSANEMEKMLRALTTAMGSNCAVCTYPMRVKEAKKAIFPGSISKAIALGQALIDARQQESFNLEEFMATWGGKVLLKGEILDMESNLNGGFLSGKVEIALPDINKAVVHFQNEFLAVEQKGKFLATTPDIIVMFDEESILPIPVERVRYGLQVTVCTLPAPAMWYTEAGLKLVGAEAFGFI